MPYPGRIRRVRGRRPAALRRRHPGVCRVLPRLPAARRTRCAALPRPCPRGRHLFRRAGLPECAAATV